MSSPPLEPPPLGLREVHVWSFARPALLSLAQELTSCLSAEERGRAGRFALVEARLRFELGRGMLRHLLAAYLGDRPDALALCRGRNGKPRLVPAVLGFNVSHAGDYTLCAVARQGELGVDVVRVAAGGSHERLACHFFTRRERAAARSIRARERPAALAACWARKEALVKAIGVGLSVPLDRFEVPVQNGAPVEVPTCDGHPAAWALHDIPSPAGYRAALAAPPRTGRVLLVDVAAASRRGLESTP